MSLAKLSLLIGCSLFTFHVRATGCFESLAAAEAGGSETLKGKWIKYVVRSPGSYMHGTVAPGEVTSVFSNGTMNVRTITRNGLCHYERQHVDAIPARAVAVFDQVKLGARIRFKLYSSGYDRHLEIHEGMVTRLFSDGTFEATTRGLNGPYTATNQFVSLIVGVEL